MKISPAFVRHAVVTLLALMACSAFAQSGVNVGVAVFPSDAVVLNARVAVPLFEARDVQHAVRADVAYAFEGAPAAAASYVLSGAPEGEVVERYLGAGLGLAFPEAPVASPLVSAHGLVGLRVPVTNRLHVFTEATVAANGFGTGLDLGLGVAYTFGGTN